MNPLIQAMAKELATHINQTVNLPFLNEEQEQIFFELVVAKVLELILGQLLNNLEKRDKED